MDMVTVIPTNEDIERLVSFLPTFSSKDYNPILNWQLENHPDGMLQISPPIYKQEVYDFMLEASKECWVDRKYLDHMKNIDLNDAGAIESLEITQIKTVVTYIVRCERFSSGHLASMFSYGVPSRLLLQLVKIQKDSLPIK